MPARLQHQIENAILGRTVTGATREVLAVLEAEEAGLRGRVEQLLRTHERGVAMTEGALARISDSAREDIVDELERARSWHERFAGELREVLS